MSTISQPTNFSAIVAGMFSTEDLRRRSRSGRFSSVERDSAPTIGRIKVSRHSVDRTPSSYEDHSRHISTQRATSPSLTRHKRFSYHSDAPRHHLSSTTLNLSQSNLHQPYSNLQSLTHQSHQNHFTPSHQSHLIKSDQGHVVKVSHNLQQASPSSYQRPHPHRSLSVDRHFHNAGNTSISVNISGDLDNVSVNSPQNLSSHYRNTALSSSDLSSPVSVRLTQKAQTPYLPVDHYSKYTLQSAKPAYSTHNSRYDYSYSKPLSTYPVSRKDVTHHSIHSGVDTSYSSNMFNPKNFSALYSDKPAPRSYSLPQVTRHTPTVSKPRDLSYKTVQTHKQYVVSPEVNVDDQIKEIKLRANSRTPSGQTRVLNKFADDSVLSGSIRIRASNKSSSPDLPLGPSKVRPKSCNTDYKINYATGNYEPLFNRYNTFEPVHTKYDFVPLHPRHHPDDDDDVALRRVHSKYHYEPKKVDFEPAYKKYEHLPIHKTSSYKVTSSKYNYEPPTRHYEHPKRIYEPSGEHYDLPIKHYEVSNKRFTTEPFVDKYENFVPLYKKYEHEPIRHKYHVDDTYRKPPPVYVTEAHNRDLLLEANRTLGRKIKKTSPEPHPGDYFDSKNKPHFTSPLKSKKCFEGDSVRLSCTLTSSPDTMISWYHDRDLLKTNRKYKISVSFCLLFYNV